MASAEKKFISIVVPVYNEHESVLPLVEQIIEATTSLYNNQIEIILVDDGSNDNSWNEIRRVKKIYPTICHGVRLRRNFGKSSALGVGFDRAEGDTIITMDGDLQDIPKEIPRFLEKIEEGYDLVSGWKQRRNDPFSKTIPSRIFNFVTSRVTGLKLHDFNCGFKCYRREVVKTIEIYGELHRFTPILAHHYGFKVAEIPVEHAARIHGKSKYGFARFFRGFMDLLTVQFTTQYLNRPGHLLGGIGVFAGLAGAACLGYLTWIWYFNNSSMGNRPLFFLGILLVLLSVQLISLGLVAELINRSFGKRDSRRLVSVTTDQETYNVVERAVDAVERSPLSH